jgi:hypothetical protein
VNVFFSYSADEKIYKRFVWNYFNSLLTIAILMAYTQCTLAIMMMSECLPEWWVWTFFTHCCCNEKVQMKWTENLWN